MYFHERNPNPSTWDFGRPHDVSPETLKHHQKIHDTRQSSLKLGAFGLGLGRRGHKPSQCATRNPKPLPCRKSCDISSGVCVGIHCHLIALHGGEVRPTHPDRGLGYQALPLVRLQTLRLGLCEGSSGWEESGCWQSRRMF